MNKETNIPRILLVDDNPAIHEDFCKILVNNNKNESLISAKAALFDNASVTTVAKTTYVIDSAYQGNEGVAMVKKALVEKNPYALGFIDIRMPPGWDGIETIRKMWEIDRNMQMVICSAYSDYSWENITEELTSTGNLLILKKPFEVIEILQVASALTQKWLLNQQIQYQLENLANMVSTRTRELEESNSLAIATLESIQEGIIAVDLDGKIITHNKVFLDLWKVTAEQLTSQSTKNFFEYMANLVKNPQPFLPIITELSKNPTESVRELQFHTDQFFEFYSKPRYVHNKIVGSVFSFKEVTQYKKLEQELLHQATHDVLTGLPNRALLIDRIQQAIFHAKRKNLQVGVLLLDLDDFKQVNDSLGHNAGDHLIKTVANQLQNHLRQSDTIARLGGDEFVIILTAQIDQEEIMNKAYQLAELFLKPWKINNYHLIITTSIGISIYPKDGENPDILIKNADAAMYHSKSQGKNSIQFYNKEFNIHLLERAELATDLRQALARNEFIVDYQPLVKLESGKITGVEALLRWHHPTRGPISPNTFIPIAEETGLIISIGEWVLKTACSQTKEWQKTIAPNLCIAVNISAYQFKQDNFVDLIKNTLAKTKLDAKYLELEMTESLILGNVNEVAQKMLELKMLGVRLAIDDFGTGYASLSYLKYFPFDKVKIDKNFIDGISSTKEDSLIVEAIITMTQSMGLEVLAEGVEKKDQIDFLRRLNSTQVQGFYYSPGLDAEKLTALLKEKSTEKA